MSEREINPHLDLTHVDTKGPHAFVQWQGTNACLDLRCKCGAHGHVDDYFVFFARCSECGQLYALDSYVAMHPIAPDANVGACEPFPFGELS